MAGEEGLEGGGFQVDPDAAAKAKASGEYGTPEDDKTRLDDGKKAADDAKKKAVIPDEDPDNPDDDKSKEEPDEDADKSKDDVDDKGDDDDKSKDDKPKPDEQFEQSQLKWTKEFMDTGELSPETRKEIGEAVFAKGVPQDVIDGYLDGYTSGTTALGAQALASAHEVVGGQEEYTKMAQWASANLSKEEIATFDTDVSGTDFARRDSAIKGLHARMSQAVGLDPDQEPNLAHDGGRGAGEPIIESRQQLAVIMASKEYQRDQAVRDKVERQLRQSKATGKYRTS